MIGACPSGIAAAALARDVLASADCLISSEVQQGYTALLAPGGAFASALTVGLTIYVAVFGYRLALGLTSLTLGEVVPHFIKIGVILALATSWPSYQALVFATLFHGPEQLADIIVRQAAGTPGDVLSALQEVFARLTDAAGKAWSQGPPVPLHAPTIAAATSSALNPVAPSPATAALPALGEPQLVAALLWLSALVLMAASVGVLLVVRIVLAMLLLLGPAFVAFALFRTTRGVAEGWLRVTVKFALVPLFALPLIAAAVAVLAPIVAGFDDTPVIGLRDGPVLLALLVVLVFAAVMVQAARLGGGIAGSIRLPRSRGAAAIDIPTPPVAASENRLVPTSRADAIVQAIAFGGRRSLSADGGPTPGSIAATRIIAGAAPAPQPLADSSSRLGQSYRRLVVAQTARPARARG